MSGLTRDSSIKFLFRDTDVRGELAYLDDSLLELIAIHQYPPTVTDLLGQFLSAAVLLSTTIKFEGRLVLQAQSEGQIPLLMAECSSELVVRGIARGAEQTTSTRFEQLFHKGQLAITIEPRQGQRYQGIVPLSGDNLATSIEHYFANSEQLPTRLWLAGGQQRCAGLLLQQLPAQLISDHDQRQQQWEHLCTLADTLQPEELSGLAPEALLHRLYHQESIQLFEPQRIQFACSCSRQRCLDALQSMGPATLEELLEEEDSITMDCEFCNQQYRFERGDFPALSGAEPGQSIH